MMKILLGVLFALALFVAMPAPASALSLAWDAVTTGTDGLPLGTGLEVKSYNVYQCGPGIGTCSLTTGVKVGTVTAPTVQFDISTQPTPSTYFVTAVNIVGESTESVVLKVVKPTNPKNFTVK